LTGVFLKPTASVPSTVQVLSVPEVGVPRTGVTKVGEVAKTNEPEPVSSVTAAARLAEDGVPKKVATPEPNEVMPVPPEATGRAVERAVVPLTTKLPPTVTPSPSEPTWKRLRAAMISRPMLFIEEGGHPSAMFTPLTSVLFPAVAEYSEIFAFVTLIS
jgi:hypothetical protein